MRLKPEDLRKIAQIFYELTINKYKIYVVQENGVYDMDLTKMPQDGIDQLIEKSLLAAFNSVISKQVPEPLPPTVQVKTATFSGSGRQFSPYANEYLWSISSKTEQ